MSYSNFLLVVASMNILIGQWKAFSTTWNFFFWTHWHSANTKDRANHCPMKFSLVSLVTSRILLIVQYPFMSWRCMGLDSSRAKCTFYNTIILIERDVSSCVIPGYRDHRIQSLPAALSRVRALR